MATINALDLSLSGQTGSGTFVGANTPTLITPNLGNAISSGIVFSPTTAGVRGTTVADESDVLIVGEFKVSTVLVADAISPADGVPTNLTSLSLSAGDWDISGTVYFATSGAATTWLGWFNTVSATTPDAVLVSGRQTSASLTNEIFDFAVSPTRLLVSSGTTIYLSVLVSFSSGTALVGGQIMARRSR